jgi:hypothetical protein
VNRRCSAKTATAATIAMIARLGGDRVPAWVRVVETHVSIPPSLPRPAPIAGITRYFPRARLFLDVRARESSVNGPPFPRDPGGHFAQPVSLDRKRAMRSLRHQRIVIAFSTKCSSRRSLFSRTLTKRTATLVSFSDDFATRFACILSSILRPGHAL